MKDMKSNILKAFPAVMALAVTASCSNFLEETSQDEIKPQSANDYRELIAGEIYNKTNTTAIHTYLDIMTDDCEEFAKKATLGSDTRDAGYGYFTWQQKPELQVTGALNNDAAWSFYYHQILVSNMILYDIDKMNGTDQEKALVSAEAHAIRAYAYFMLVNLYGEPYDPATAGSALGVPVNDLVGAENRKFVRESVQRIYDLIVGDCEKALSGFEAGGDNNTIYRWNGNAVSLLLARVYLYMQNWDQAIAYANRVISVKGDLWDLNQKAAEGDETAGLYFLNSRNPEILFSFGYYYINYFATGAKGAYPVSEGLKAIYEEGDLRYGASDGAYIRNQGSSFMGGGKRYLQYKYDDASYSGVHGRAFRTAEAYLIRAEAYSQKPDSYAKALDDLNFIRKNRFTAEKYAPLSGKSQEEVIQAVRDERRREMCFEQLRWFDLRRWDRPRIVHTYTPSLNDLADVRYYVLEQNDPAYTLPVPSAVFEKDSDLQDILRPERTELTTNPDQNN